MSIQWPLVLFSLIAGTGGSLLAYAGLSGITKPSLKTESKAGIIGVILVVVGGICSIFHLGHPESFMAAISHLGSFSGISVELMLAGALVVSGIIYFACAMRGAEGGAKVFGIINIILAVVFGFMMGMSYMLEAQPAWNNILLPLSYMLSVLACGGFLYLALAENEEKSSINETLIMAVFVCSIAAAVCVLIYGFMSGGFSGAEKLIFFIISVVGGAFAAAGAWILKSDASKTNWLWIGLAGAVVCALFVRLYMWAAGSGWIDAFVQAAANGGKYFFQ